MSRQVKTVRGSDNVFGDLGFPEGGARNLALRSELMIHIEAFVEKSGLTQAQAAAVLGLTRPRVNSLMRGRLEKFSLDALVNTATRAGFRVELRITTRKRASDRTSVAA